MNNKSLAGIVIFLMVIIIVVVVWNYIKNSHHMGSPMSSLSQRTPLPKEVTIFINKNGFSPKDVTIKAGSAVRWKNESGAAQTVNSDNYPTNQIHRELNFGVFNNGSSVVYTFTIAGTYGYHNQFTHTQEGKVIVTQ